MEDKRVEGGEKKGRTELARFREQWKAEVRERRAGAPAQPSASARSTTTERAASTARSDTSTKTVTATTSNTHCCAETRHAAQPQARSSLF